MHKRAGLLLLFAASMTAVAASSEGPLKIRLGQPPVPKAPVLPAAAAVQSSVQAPVSGAISSSIARWNSLRQTDSLPFSSYASFLMSHRGWPGETAMRRTAERQIDPSTSSPGEVIAFFRAFPPLTATGHARHAFALLASGQADQARAAARQAWTMGVLPQPDEQRLLGAFGGALAPADHDARMDALLGNGDTQSAQRTLASVSPSRRPLYEARLALQTRAPDARSRTDALGSAFSGDPGLLIDKVNWLRNSDPLGARQLLARPRQLTKLPANPEKFMETMVTMARGAVADRQWTLAYDIASKVDDIFPTGTDISARSYGERDEYTNLTWLAGTSAQRVGRHSDAAGMFDRYARAGRSGQTRSKGLYWAARSGAAAGQTQQSGAWLEQAAGFPDQFYGQLALERLGRPVGAPAPAAAPTPAERTAFAARPLVQAARALGERGNWSDQSLFVRAIAEQVEGDRDRLLAAEYGRALGRLDLGVWVAREARNKGESFYAAPAFPEVQMPGAYSHNWALAHGITRQESSFDRAAVSHAGARGMMQLMPATARQTASRLGLPYDFGRLTSDPSYNVMLGSSYFDSLLNQWGGNVPLAVASYNAGPGNVRRWVRENGDPRTPGVDIVEWIEQIPFFETRNYVQRVLENAVVYEAIRAQRNGTAASANRLSSYLGKSRPG